MTQCITDSGLVRRHAGADVPIFRASNAVFPERRIAALSREPVMAALSSVRDVESAPPIPNVQLARTRYLIA